MTKKSLRKFNPNKVAEIELHMWQAYYRHRFIKLFFLLTRLTRENFGVNYLVSIQIAYHAAIAAVDFRINKSRENTKRISNRLTRFFQVISEHSTEPFNYRKVAELELQWWLVDRYPDRYKISRKESLTLAMATVYNVDPSILSEYANKRADAMVLQDGVENLKGVEADWDKIGLLLKDSWRSLYQAIQ